MFCNRKMLQKYEEEGEMQCISVAWYRKLIQKKHEMSNDTKKKHEKHKYKNEEYFFYHLLFSYTFFLLLLSFFYTFLIDKKREL